MIYGSWDMERDRQNCLSFLASFCPFTPLTTWKIKILKNRKKKLEISSFYTSVTLMRIIWYIVPKIWSVTDRIFSHVAPFFALYPTNNTKIKILRKWKNTWKYHHFTHVYLNYNYMMYDCWDMKGDRQRFLSFWTILCHFTPLTTQNSNLGYIVILSKCMKIMIICYTVSETWLVTYEIIIFHFGRYFALLPL